MSRVQTAYARDATDYDTRTASYARYRAMVVDRLPLRPGDTVIDAGCGTGLCFAAVQRRIGPSGVLVGVDAAPEMLSLAAERAAAAGWSNVVLTCAPLEDAELPQADHVLFCAVHDIMQSRPALDNVLGHLRPGGHVAAGGGKWGPVWAVGLNAGVLALHAPYVRDFAGFGRPWEPLAERVPDLAVQEVAMGAGFLATAAVRQPPRR
jgi:SAM-dependent methyltransferase